MSAEGGPPPRVRRMLPSVSEVLKELTARGEVEPDVAFRAAREVCAEELKRIRDAGGDSVPIEDLVERAWIRATGGARPVPRAAAPVFELEPPAAPADPLAFATEPEPLLLETPSEPPPVPPGPLDLGAAPARVAEQVVEDPFSETTGAMDLRWDGETREPFSEPHAGVPAVPAPAPVDAPTLRETAILPGGPAPLSFGEARGGPFALPAEAPPGETRGADVRGAVPASVDEDAEGPGDETLNRLSREAEAIDLNAVFPKAAEPAAIPFALPDDRPGTSFSAGVEPAPEPFDDEEDTVLTVPGRGRRRPAEKRKAGPRFGILLGMAAGLAALAGLGYLLAGLWMERDAVPTPVPVARPRPTATPALVAAAPAATEALPPTAAPAAAPGEAASAPTATAVPTLPVVPTATAKTVPVPSPTPDRPPAPAPVVAVAPSAAPAAAPVARSRDGLVVTRDRAGQPTVFSIHFTSYKDRASAEKDLRRVSGLVGREGFVAEIDLGEKGTWYRVMIGEFPTAQEAKAAREELAAKGTRDMGWVYRVVGPEAGAPR